MRDKTDAELMRLVMAKERQALEQLYDRYVKLVYSFAYRSTQNEEAAKEIVQLVFTRLWTTEKGYDETKGEFVNWLLTITRNLTIDRARRERRHGTNVHWKEERWQRLSDNGSEHPEQVVERRSLRREIEQAYAVLSDSQIRLLRLLYWEGYTLSEIADLCNEPLGTVKSRLHQTLKLLRKSLSGAREGVKPHEQTGR